jgi:hypothetical protein
LLNKASNLIIPRAPLPIACQGHARTDNGRELWESMHPDRTGHFMLAEAVARAFPDLFR